MATGSSPARELVITGLFDAPRELVWKGWTVPEHAKQWWGPKGFTAPVCEIDFRVGGKYLFCMQSPQFNEGRGIWSTGVYREIVPLERIVCTDSFADEKGNIVPATHYGMGADFPLELLVTLTFEDVGGKTKMTLRHAGMPSDTAADAQQGWNESFDKLAEALAKGSDRMRLSLPSDREIVLTRVFDAPREVVWRAWTEQKRVDQWWGPRGFRNATLEMTVKPGGVWRYVMHGPNGVDYPNRIIYSEVVKPERLVYNHGSGEENDAGQFHVTVTFAAQGGKTELTMRSLFPSAAERDKVIAFGAIEGGNQTLDRLAEHLAKEELNV